MPITYEDEHNSGPKKLVIQEFLQFKNYRLSGCSASIRFGVIILLI